ncbi:MAG: Uma2 family endonuclease [Polyangiaceae bacterium]
MSTSRRGQAPGPFRADQLRSGDPYELRDGHALFVPPSGQAHGKANLVGGAVLETDPKVESAGVDVGFSPRPKDLRAPDVSVGNVESMSGWAKRAPALAVEYADRGQDEEKLAEKIADLLAEGTRFVWVVRLVGKRRVEVHEPGKPVTTVGPGEVLQAPGVLQNTVPVEALYDRDAAHEATLANLLQRRGYRDLEAVRSEGREEGREAGREAGRVEALRDAVRSLLTTRGMALDAAGLARIEACDDVERLKRWLVRAGTESDVRLVLRERTVERGKRKR